MSGIEAAFFGALGGDAGEVRTSKNGKNYLRLNVRVGDGEGATWVSVLAFDPRAIEQADKFIKGARLYVEGKLSSDEWTAQDGTKRHGLSVMSWHCRLSEIGRNKKPQPKRTGDAKPPAQNKSAAAGSAGQDFNDEIPF